MNAIALIIGNANYALEKNKLANAVNDAEDVRAKLNRLGFVVKLVQNCNRETFEREVREFAEALENYDVGLFYYAGHGLQIKGINYLTSIDTSFADQISARNTAYPVNEVLEYMEKANPIVKIIILDACRDNPLPVQFRGVHQSGLAPIYAPKGTIIAFSTSPGESAMDYGTDRNSIYTNALLNHIDDENVSIEDFFKRVRTTVYTLSNGKQTSWEHTSLIGNFCFNAGQLVHSLELPYKEEYISDTDFQSSGSKMDNIISDLREHNWYKQQSALCKLEKIDRSLVGQDTQFLLGRNILQTADGEEFTALSIMRNLDSWLKNWFMGKENHVLNGILFEIYFDSNGRFRQGEFKSDLIDDVYALHGNNRYDKSFQFIQKQLSQFSDFPFYIPSIPPTTLPIEIAFEKIEEDSKIEHKLKSIKIHDNEVMQDVDDDSLIDVTYKVFLKKLYSALCAPHSCIRISLNVEERYIKTVVMPSDIVLG